MLAGLGVVGQRYRAVLEVLEEGTPVTEVARRYGVARQAVHEWLPRCAGRRAGGAGRLVAATGAVRASDACGGGGTDRGAAAGGAPGWGASRILRELERSGPGRRRCRAGRRLPGADPARPGRPGEPQAQAGGLPAPGARPGDAAAADGRDGPRPPGGQEVKVVTGIDDHSRFVVCAKAVVAATARPVCLALAEALRPAWDPRADPHRQRQRFSRPGPAAARDR